MELGTSLFTRCGRTFCFVVAASILAVSSVAAAQQSANGVPSGQSGSPTAVSAAASHPLSPAASPALPGALPAGQPASQVAVGSPGTSVTPKSIEVLKDTSDQPTMIKLGAGDLLDVNVYNVPELTSKVRVSSSGDIYLPLIDYVHVEGVTQEEAQTLIEKRLADGGFVRSPHVTIFVDEATSQGVTVIGEVTRPGIYPDVPDHRLYKVISEAGGFTASASRNLAIIRQGVAEPVHIVLPRNLADDMSGNVEVLPGDTITIPRAPIIYVVGDVGRPSGLLMDNGTPLTVLQAVALAGGINRTAKLGGVRIIRKGPTGMIETRIEIKKMLEAKVPDVTLQADDILFIPVSGGRVLANRTLEAAMSAATMVSAYNLHP
jgi:polysaccharide biosynthesis/export protein